MKKLDKYILTRFAAALSGSLVFILGMYFITIYVDNLKYFSSPNVSIYIILKYIQYLLPEIIIQVLPVAALFSTSYVFGALNSSNEIIAIYNGRIGFIRVMIPLLFSGALLSVSLFFFFENVATESSQKAFFMKSYIKNLSGKDIFYMYSHARFFLKGQDNTFYYLENFDSRTSMLFKPVMFRFDKDGVLEFQLFADSGRYKQKDEQWEFRNAIIERYNMDGTYREERFGNLSMKLAEKPGSFMKKPLSVMQMKMEDALIFIEAKKDAGQNFKKELVEYNWRFAFPVSVTIVVLIGSVAGIYFRKAVIVLSFFLSILLSFGYYGLLALGIAFGKSGRLSPEFAAWMANIAYITAGIIALKLKR